MGGLLGSSDLLWRANDYGLRPVDSWVGDSYHRVGMLTLHLLPLLALLLCGLQV